MPPDETDSATRLWKDPGRPKSSLTARWAFDAGEIVADRFRIVASLGLGGMGEVFRAEDLRLGQTVALKFVAPQLAANHATMEALAGEVRIGRQVSHPNVCRIYDLIEHGEQRFLAMEYVDGEDLASLLRRIGRPSPEKALALCAQIAAGIAAAHDRRVTHRDLKPANIMIDGDGMAKVADFGLAVEVGHDQGFAGTPAYMAPEQLAGRPVGPKTDIYALGLVMWETLTGRRLFDGASLEEIRGQHKAPKGRPSALVGPLDPSVEEMLLRCLEEDSDRRPASVREVLDSFPPGLVGSDDVSTSGSARTDSRGSAPSDRTSIAVLPFEDFGADDDDWFAVGLADEIIADLAKIKALRVISRGSTMRFKGVQECRPVAMQLGVRFVLTGSVRRAGSRLRVTTNLVDGLDDSLFWSERFQGSDDDAFDIQEEIARAVAEQLEIELSADEVEDLAEREIDNPIVQECYVRARDQVWSYTEVGLRAALRLLEKGLAHAPDNVLLLATAGTAWWQYFNSGIRPVEASLERADEYARRIFALEPDSPHAHRILGLTAVARGDIFRSVESLRRVVELAPEDGDALAMLSCVLSLAGLTEAARPLAKRAIEVDPLGAMSQFAPVFDDWYQGRFESAVESARRAGTFEPENPAFFYSLWSLLKHAHRDEEAALLVEMVPRMEDGTFTRLLRFHHAAFEGDHAEAERHAELIEASARLDLQYSSVMCEGWALLGETDLSLDWLRNAVGRGFLACDYLTSYSRCLESVRGNPQFLEIVDKARGQQAKLRERLAGPV